MKKSIMRALSCLMTVAMLATLVCTATFTAAAAVIKLGDATGDGEINMKDVLAVRKYVGGLAVELDMAAADANDDGAVNMKDVLAIRKHVASIEELGVKSTVTYYEDYDPKSGIDYEDPTINFIEGTDNTLGVWWWQQTTDEEKIRTYMELFQKNQVTEIYYECYTWLYQDQTNAFNREALHNFVQLAEEYGMRVAAIYDDRSVLKGNQNKMALYQRVTFTEGDEYTLTCDISNLDGELALCFSDADDPVTDIAEGTFEYTFTAEKGMKYVMFAGDRSSYTVSNVKLTDNTVGDGANVLKNGDFSVDDTRSADFGWTTGNTESWTIADNVCTVQNGMIPFNRAVEGFLQYKSEYPDDALYAIHCDVEPKTEAEINSYVNNFIPVIAAARERGVPVELDLSCNMVNQGGNLVTYDHPEYGTIKGIYNIIAANCDGMILMSYRDTANGIYGCAAEAQKSAKIYHTRLVFGIEMGNSGEGDKVDFSDEGRYTAFSELYKLDQKLIDRDFGKEAGEEFAYGYAIHSEIPFKTLRIHWGEEIADPTIEA